MDGMIILKFLPDGMLNTNLFIFTEICVHSSFISLLISNLTDNQLWVGALIQNEEYISIFNRKGDWKYAGQKIIFFSFSLCSYFWQKLKTINKTELQTVENAFVGLLLFSSISNNPLFSMLLINLFSKSPFSTHCHFRIF